MMHLYIGVEVIREAITRNVQRREGLSEADLIAWYGVGAEKYPKTALIIAIRQRVVSQGDAATLSAA